jgi:hypothetical protein
MTDEFHNVSTKLATRAAAMFGILLPCLATLALRIAVLGRPPFTDAGWYTSVAWLSRQGLGTVAHSPISVYPRLLSWIFDVADQPVLWFRLVDALMAIAASAMVFTLLACISSRKVACVVATFWAIAANLRIFIDGGFKNQIIAATAFTGASLTMLLMPRNWRSPIYAATAAGILGAFAVLLREAFLPYAAIGAGVCLLRMGARCCAAWCIGAAATFLAGLWAVSGSAFNIPQLIGVWRETAAALTNLSAVAARPWSSVFEDSATQTLRSVAWVIPFAVAAISAGVWNVIQRRTSMLRHLPGLRSILATPRRIAALLGFALLLAPIPEMVLKLVFPYHFSQLFLGLAVLCAAAFDPVLWSLRGYKRVMTAAVCVSTLVAVIPAIRAFDASKYAWRESSQWWPVMVEGERRPELIANSFYLRLGDAVKRATHPGDRVLVSGLYFASFSLAKVLPVSGNAADATFLTCSPHTDARKAAVEQLRLSKPEVVVESRRIATDISEYVPDFPANYRLFEELTPGAYASYSPYDAKVWVRIAD